jgi:hypothetical protein
MLLISPLVLLQHICYCPMRKDGIFPKILKIAEPAIVKPITDLINKTIKTSEFPKKLKEAQVVPCFKKNNTLDKSNYRPVSCPLLLSSLLQF